MYSCWSSNCNLNLLNNRCFLALGVIITARAGYPQSRKSGESNLYKLIVGTFGYWYACLGLFDGKGIKMWLAICCCFSFASNGRLFFLVISLVHPKTRVDSIIAIKSKVSRHMVFEVFFFFFYILSI